MEQRTLDTARSGLAASLGLTAAGIGLLWWADNQLVNLRISQGSTFETQSFRLALWSLTLIVAGLAFGLIVTRFAGLTVTRRSISISAVLVGVPLIWAHMLMAGWSLSDLLFLPTPFVLNQMGPLAIVVGFLLSGLVGPRIGERNRIEA